MSRAVSQSREPHGDMAPRGRGYGHSSRQGPLERLVIYLPPWLVWLSVYVLAIIFWRLWGTNYDARPWFAMGAFICTLLAAWQMWRYAEPRGEHLRLLATGSTFAAGMWFIVAVITSPFGQVVWSLYLGFGLATCVFWNMRRALMGDGTQVLAASGPAARLIEALRGARLGNPKVLEVEGGTVVETPLEVDRGQQTIADLQAAVKVLEASVEGIRPGAMRVQQNPKDAGRGVLVTVPKDPLQGTQFWPGPSAPGQSVHLGAPIGPYETGGVARLFVTGDDKLVRALAQWLVMGMTGAGKSSAMRMVVADFLTRTDFVCWAHDHVKGLQTLAPLLGGLDWVTMELAEGKKMLRAVRVAIRARTDHLGRNGLEQWEPGCGLSLLMVWLEEATDLGDLESLKQLVREARSVGIAIFVSMQRASHDNVDTSTRSQFGGGWCFGVRDATDAGFCLPDPALDNGAAPENWQNERPGYCYLTGPGIPVEFWPVPIRAWRATKEQLEAAVEAGRQFRQPLDDVTAEAVRKLGYGDRPDPLSFLADDRPGTDVAEAGIDGELVNDEEQDDEEMADMPEDLDPEITADPDQPVEPLDVDVPLGDPDAVRPQLSTEQARGVIQRHLAAIHAEGRGHTTAADVWRMRPACGRTREWVRLELIRLQTDAQPTEFGTARERDDVPGVFHISPPRTVRELASAPA